MAQLKRYNGTSWENVGGSVAPKTSQTTSDTDTYSCNYVNNNLTNIKSAIDYKSPDYMGDVVVESIRSKNMLNPYEIIQGTISANDGSYSNIDICVVSNYVKVKANKSYTLKLNNVTSNQFIGRIVLYNTSKVFNSTLFTSDKVEEYTITPTIDGYIRIMFGKGLGGTWSALTPSDIISTNPQIEEGSTATVYSPYQNLTGEENYSTGEIRIGTWVDGKPLYRKILTLGALKNNGETIANYDSTFIIQKFEVYVENPSLNVKFTLPLAGTNYINCFDDGANHLIKVQTSNDRTAFTDNYAIIEYTKTTD